ncbi:Hypothetical Protein RRSL_04337 [Ralstonia solanacearum UW551]|uniref:Uncharacterized protein n=1 Tax=Ralstonia solanacearum (strain UW551) TaxID=342110 RepID=A0AB33VI62_RALSU|nr:Hypothetical Protein RRSL_04337 [Ralstonia solanacearum UW551]
MAVETTRHRPRHANRARSVRPAPPAGATVSPPRSPCVDHRHRPLSRPLAQRPRAYRRAPRRDAGRGAAGGRGGVLAVPLPPAVLAAVRYWRGALRAVAAAQARGAPARLSGRCAHHRYRAGMRV